MYDTGNTANASMNTARPMFLIKVFAIESGTSAMLAYGCSSNVSSSNIFIHASSKSTRHTSSFTVYCFV